MSILNVFKRKAKNNYKEIYTRKFLLDDREYKFYRLLKPFADEYDLHILGKVKIIDFINVNCNLSEKKRKLYNNKINKMHVDFLICNPENLYPLAAIKLYNSTQNSLKEQEKDKFIDIVIESVNIPLYRIKNFEEKNIKNIMEEIHSYKKKNEADTLKKSSYTQGTNLCDNLLYIRKSNFLSPKEYKFYQLIRPYLESYNLHLLSKVRLIDLIIPEDNIQNKKILENKVKQKHIDFVICSKYNLYPLAGIEVDGQQHYNNKKIKDNDKFKDDVFKIAKIPLYRINTNEIADQNIDDFNIRIGNIIREIYTSDRKNEIAKVNKFYNFL